MDWQHRVGWGPLWDRQGCFRIKNGSFLEGVDFFLKSREDATLPEQGWPWPWQNSQLTDFVYAFDKGKVFAACFGAGWFDPLETNMEITANDEERIDFPDMSDIQKVDFGARSGIIIFKKEIT